MDAIEQFIEGMTREEYRTDKKTQSAVERQLLIISEACGRLLDLDAKQHEEGMRLEDRFPLPWYKIRGIGNVIRHEYHAVDPEIVWNLVAVTNDLAELRGSLVEAFPQIT